jgi:G3E family GTPase
VDLVDRDQIAKIKAWLDEHFHRYRLIEAERCDVPLEILLSGGRLDAARLRGHEAHACCDPKCRDHHHGKHTNAFSTWNYETGQPLSLGALREVASRLPVNIYRCKGVIHSADAPDRRAVLQVVGKRVNISMENEWGSRTPRTQIVAIGTHATMDGDALREQFDRCLAEHLQAAPARTVVNRSAPIKLVAF